jgi:hypothetical protein
LPILSSLEVSPFLIHLAVEEIAMQFRWVIPITLWTMLSGPVLARPKPPLAGHVQGSATVVTKSPKSEIPNPKQINRPKSH